jgi:hypothetical protein
MASYTAGTTPVTLVRGRPFSLPMTWQTTATPPVAINLTGYTITGVITWSQTDGDSNSPSSSDLTCTVTDAANGLFTVALDSGTTAEVPDGQGNITLGVTLTDGSGNTSDFSIPVVAETPVGVS